MEKNAGDRLTFTHIFWRPKQEAALYSRASPKMRPVSKSQGDRKGPHPSPHRPRPYGNEAASHPYLQKPTSAERTGDRPYDTQGRGSPEGGYITFQRVITFPDAVTN
jgi:hypothetical protein